MIVINSVHFHISLGIGKINLLDELNVLVKEVGPLVLDVHLHAIDLVPNGVSQVTDPGVRISKYVDLLDWPLIFQER